MWPFNSKEKEEWKPLRTYYVVDIDKIRTVAQLKDLIRITHYSMTHRLDPEIKIGENRIEDFPALKNAVTKVDGKDA